MASRHKNPGRFKNDNFLKTLYKISALFQLSSEIRKGAAQSLTAYGWHSSKDASQHVCIYETVKNRVHILPLIPELISVDFSWNYPKKRFRCNLFQVASKVLNKHGAASQIWTGDLILTNYILPCCSLLFRSWLNVKKAKRTNAFSVFPVVTCRSSFLLYLNTFNL